MPTHMSSYPREGDTPPTTSGSSHPVPPSFLSSGEYGDSSIQTIWPKGEMTQQIPDSEEEEYEDEERRRALLGLPFLGALAGGQAPPAGTPMVQGTPQFANVPLVQGNPGGPNPALPLQAAPSSTPSQFAPPSVSHNPPPPLARAESGPSSYVTAPLAKPSSPPKHTGTGSGSTRPGPGGGSCALVALILAVVCLIIAGTIGGLFFGVPPAISVVGSSKVTMGEGLHLHGYHFFPGGSITLTLDNRLQLFSSASSATGETLSHSPSAALQVNVAGQLTAQNTPIKADGSGSFDITIPVSTAWGLGSHTLRATEGISSRSAVVNFTVEAAAARLLAEPSTLDFGKLMVGSKAILSVALNNSGGQALNWKATTGGATWLKLAPDAGKLQAGASPQFIYVTADTGQLKVGSYSATLTINSNGGRAQVSVALQVTPQGQKPQAKLSVTPNALDFGSLDAGHQLSKAIIIGNSGNLALNWKAGTGNANWVTVDTSSQTIQPGALPDTINVTVDTTNLAPGNQSAMLTISSNGGSAQVVITLAVNQPVQNPQQPCTLSAPSSSNETFNAKMGTDPAAQTLTIGVSGSCSSGVTITPAVTLASGKGWLAVSPPSAALTSGSATFTVNVASSTLPPGSYAGTIALTAESGNTAISGSPQTVGVMLTVTEVPPVLAVSPGTLAFSLSNGDSITPESFTISNTGGAPLNWTASLDANAPSFVSLSSAAGTNLVGGTNTTVNVNVNPSGVEAGNYAATVTISAIDPITGQPLESKPATVSVTITITAQPSLQLSGNSLTFTPGNCEYKASSTITIMNTGGGTLSWSVGDPLYPSGSPTGWLSVSPGQGTDTATLKFSVDGTVSKLVNGQIYTATVTITPSAGTPQTISVSFTVPYCIQ
jgi:hypothetical protein